MSWYYQSIGNTFVTFFSQKLFNKLELFLQSSHHFSQLLNGINNLLKTLFILMILQLRIRNKKRISMNLESEEAINKTISLIDLVSINYCNTIPDLNNFNEHRLNEYNLDIKDFLMSDSIYSDQEKLQRAYETVNKYYRLLIKDISTKLNQIHNMNELEKYWEKIIGSWLLISLHYFFERHEKIKRNLNIKANIQTKSKKYSNNFLFPISTNDFLINIKKRDYNEYTYLFIINYLKIPLKIIYHPINNSNLILKNQKNVNLNYFQEIKKIIKHFINRYFSNIIFYNSYIPNYKYIHLNLKKFPYFDINYSFPILNSDYNEEKRKIISAENQNDEFIKCFLSFIKYQIPMNFIENFLKIRKISLRRLPKYPKFILTANAHYHDDYFNVWCAEKCKNKKVKYIINQHGGYYGIGKIDVFENFETKICDYFITYGWKNEKYKNIIPLNSPKLKYFREQYQQSTKNDKNVITFIHLTAPKYPYYLMSFPAGDSFHLYLEQLKVFFSYLKADCLSNLNLRIQKLDFGWNLKEYYNKMNPKLIIHQEDDNFLDYIKNTKLVIISYNGTTLLETLAANIPTVIFWDLNTSGIREEAKPYFNELERVNIFFTDHIKAALFINKIYKNPSEWWSTNEVQEARQQFCKIFCNTDGDVYSKWGEFIKRLL